MNNEESTRNEIHTDLIKDGKETNQNKDITADNQLNSKEINNSNQNNTDLNYNPTSNRENKTNANLDVIKCDEKSSQENSNVEKQIQEDAKNKLTSQTPHSEENLENQDAGYKNQQIQNNESLKDLQPENTQEENLEDKKSKERKDFKSGCMPLAKDFKLKEETIKEDNSKQSHEMVFVSLEETSNKKVNPVNPIKTNDANINKTKTNEENISPRCGIEINNLQKDDDSNHKESKIKAISETKHNVSDSFAENTKGSQVNKPKNGLIQNFNETSKSCDKKFDLKSKKSELFGYYNSDAWVDYIEIRKENQKENQKENFITLDTNKITDDLYDKNEYICKNIKIKFSERNFNEILVNENKLYLANLSHENVFSYSGVLNRNFQKSNIGRNNFSNGDIYIGNWKNDKKAGYGIYYYDSGEENAFSQIYAGNFNDDGRKYKGFYFNSESSSSNFEKCSFNAFVGHLDKYENLEFGLYIRENSNDTNKSYIYIGKFEDNKKHGEYCYYYLFESRLLFYGNFKNDEIGDGIIFEISPGNNVKSAVRFNNSNNKREVISSQNQEFPEKIEIASKFIKEFNAKDILSKCKKLYADSVFLEKKYKDLYTEEHVESLSEELENVEKDHYFLQLESFR